MTDVRHAIIPAVWMIVKNSNDQIFLLERANTGWRDGWWTAPAGHIEKGESPTIAAIRELKEEAGIEVKVDSLTKSLVYFYEADDKTNERVSVFFTVTDYNGTPTNNEPHKASKAQWFDIGSLPETIIPLLKQAILDSNSGITYRDNFYSDDHFKNILN